MRHDYKDDGYSFDGIKPLFAGKGGRMIWTLRHIRRAEYIVFLMR